MKLSTPVALALAVVAGALEIIQQYAITASSAAHSVTSVVLFILIGIGIVPLGGKAIGKLIPLHYAAILTAAAGVLQVIQQTSLGVSPAVHSAIAVALLIAASLGIVPTSVAAVRVPPPPPAPVPVPVKRRPAAKASPSTAAKKTTKA